MALHPRAQVNLLKYLEIESKRKYLTVIFSTHSVTLLKSINKNNIIYLENDGTGNINPIYGCFPTFAIGNIASSEENLPDAVVYVEDEVARSKTVPLLRLFFNEKNADPTTHPVVKVLPIGGFDAVVSFMGQNRAILPDMYARILF